MTDARFAGLIAAAGRSSRMGRAKALLALDGETFVGRLADALALAGLSPVVVTLPEPPGDEPVRAALEGRSVIATRNAFPGEGLSGSVRTALDVAGDVDGLVLTPVDAPFASAELVRALLEALVARSALAVVPVVDGTRGHPVAFARGAFAALRAASERGGPRGVLADLGDDVVEVPWRDARITRNVNTPRDLEDLLRP